MQAFVRARVRLSFRILASFTVRTVAEHGGFSKGGLAF